MCGIHVIWGKGANREAIQKLVDQSHHRGPDQQAVFSPWPSLWIGVNRLKILHPGPDADQPFWAPDSNSLLIWNGEIYNYQALRDILLKTGIDFITQSDTEVLLHWLRLFGANGLEKLQGVFSLVYINMVDRSLLVARDRTGEKPLYYSQSQNTLMLSSEVLGLVKPNKSTFDLDALESYCYLRSPKPGKTFIKGISEWKPGNYSQIRHHTTFRWDQIPEQKSTHKSQSADTFRTCLSRSILKQFHADVPVGIQLSGGADSSLLYALWYQETGTPLPAFTIQTQEKYRSKYSDSIASQKLASQYPCDLNLIDVNQQIVLEHWDEFIGDVDFPVGDSAAFLTWLIGREAKSKAKVLISGAGADELWGGYRRHKAFDYYLNQKKVLLQVKGFAEKLPLSRSWKKFVGGISTNSNHTFLNYSALGNVSMELFEFYERMFNSNLPDYKRALDFDRKTYLVQDVLKIQDQSLMSHGIEGRSPYLDAEMIDFWHSVKDQNQLIDKKWIHENLADLKLDWVSKRKKLGFGLPLEEWFTEGGPFADRAFGVIETFFKRFEESLTPEVRAIGKNPQKFTKTHFLLLYNLFLLGEWLNLRKL